MARNKRGAFGALTALLLSGSLLSAIPAHAAETPSPNPSPTATGTYEEQLAAYKISFDLYKIALDKYMQDRRSAEATYKVAVGKYELDVLAFEETHKVALTTINDTFKSAIDKVRADQRNAQSGTTTPEARNTLRTAMNAAVMAATTARKNAIDSLGNSPIKPERPVFAPPPIEPRKPMQNLKGSKNPKTSPNQQIEPSKPDNQNNQQPAPNIQSKVSKPTKNQNASGDSAVVESVFTA
ncbi:MAG: hypothetical protein WCI68_06760 [Actinomycetes bacterium]